MTRHRNSFDEARARKLRATGMSWRKIALVLGCSGDTVRARIDPGYREDRDIKRRQVRAGSRPKGRAHNVASTADTNRDAAAFLAAVPQDTRDLTARLMGDPLPSRSGLDQREAAMNEFKTMASASPTPEQHRAEQRRAYFTFDEVAYRENGHCLYYFAPATRAPGPYPRQRHVTAIIDIASDGTLAGVELIDDMPPLSTQEGKGP